MSKSEIFNPENQCLFFGYRAEKWWKTWAWQVSCCILGVKCKKVITTVEKLFLCKSKAIQRPSLSNINRRRVQMQATIPHVCQILQSTGVKPTEILPQINGKMSKSEILNFENINAFFSGAETWRKVGLNLMNIGHEEKKTIFLRGPRKEKKTNEKHKKFWLRDSSNTNKQLSKLDQNMIFFPSKKYW